MMFLFPISRLVVVPDVRDFPGAADLPLDSRSKTNEYYIIMEPPNKQKGLGDGLFVGKSL